MLPRDLIAYRLLGAGDPEHLRGRVYDGTDAWTCTPAPNRLRRRNWRGARLKPLPPQHVPGCTCLRWLSCAWLPRPAP